MPAHRRRDTRGDHPHHHQPAVPLLSLSRHLTRPRRTPQSRRTINGEGRGRRRAARPRRRGTSSSPWHQLLKLPFIVSGCPHKPRKVPATPKIFPKTRLFPGFLIIAPWQYPRGLVENREISASPRKKTRGPLLPSHGARFLLGYYIIMINSGVSGLIGGGAPMGESQFGGWDNVASGLKCGHAGSVPLLLSDPSQTPTSSQTPPPTTQHNVGQALHQVRKERLPPRVPQGR
jgi:hypothetical protein